MTAKNKVALVHHKQTRSTWANCQNWHERWQTETIEYGHLEYDTNNIFEVKKHMEFQGYVYVKNDPFKMMYNLPVKPYSDKDFEEAKKQDLNLDDWEDYEKYFSLGEEDDYNSR